MAGNDVEDITAVLLDILTIGILRIRVCAWGGDSAACVVEANHIHDIPAFIQLKQIDPVKFYYEHSRPALIKSATLSADGFTALWERLRVLLYESNTGK